MCICVCVCTYVCMTAHLKEAQLSEEGLNRDSSSNGEAVSTWLNGFRIRSSHNKNTIENSSPLLSFHTLSCQAQKCWRGGEGENGEEAGELKEDNLWKGDLEGNLILGKHHYHVAYTCCTYLL